MPQSFEHCLTWRDDVQKKRYTKTQQTTSIIL